MRWRRVAQLALLLIAVALGAFACNTPTIPIPPLSAPSFHQLTEGNWTASGGSAAAGSEVIVIDRQSGDGVVARADAAGNYMTAPFPGRAGDTVELYYRTPENVAPSICARLGEGAQTAARCP
jgi:hypothetical protein